jgi:hypothetical protein
LDEWVALSSFLPMLGRSRRGLHEYQAVAASMGREKSRGGWVMRRGTSRDVSVRSGQEEQSAGGFVSRPEDEVFRTNFYT